VRSCARPRKSIRAGASVATNAPPALLEERGRSESYAAAVDRRFRGDLFAIDFREQIDSCTSDVPLVVASHRRAE
jgi:hypothetical protein